MNVPWLRVRRRSRVAILSTGNEVVMPREPAGPHQIIGSNGLALAAFVTANGGAPAAWEYDIFGGGSGPAATDMCEEARR